MKKEMDMLNGSLWNKKYDITLNPLVVYLNINLIKNFRRYITMENVMTNGFAGLSAIEMETIDGGKWYNKVIDVAGRVVGAAACTNSVTAPIGADCFAVGAALFIYG